MNIKSFIDEFKYCGNCGINNKNQNLKTCSRCKKCCYCSIDCQKKHWILHKQECIKSELSRKKIFQIIMDWFDGFLQLPMQLNPLTIMPKDKFLLITINDINKLTLDYDKLSDLYKEIFSQGSISLLYEVLSRTGLAKDCSKAMKIYEKKRIRRIPIFIVSNNHDIFVLHIHERY